MSTKQLFAHQNQHEHETERDALGLLGLLEPTQQIHQHLVIDEDFLLLVRLGHGGLPVREHALRPLAGLPRLVGNVQAFEAFAFFDECGDELFAGFHRAAGHDAHAGRSLDIVSRGVETGHRSAIMALGVNRFIGHIVATIDAIMVGLPLKYRSQSNRKVQRT